MGDNGSGRGYFEDNWPSNQTPSAAPNDRHIVSDAFNGLGVLRLLLDAYGGECASGQSGQPIQYMGASNGHGGLADPREILVEARSGLMPPAGSGGTDQMLGRIQAMVEVLSQRSAEEREDARERGRKMDALLDRLGTLDARIAKVAADSDAIDVRSTRALDEASKSLKASMEVISLNLQALQAKQEATTTKVGQLSTQTENILSDQTKLRSEVAEVKLDTGKLQVSIRPVDAIRTRMVALWALLGSLGAFAFYAFYQGIVGAMVSGALRLLSP